ncbi:MAG: hypothetical protein WA628_03235 [Terriglobales bacterium]
MGATGLSPDIVKEVGASGADILLSDSGTNVLSDLQIIPELRKAVPHS